MKTTHTLFIFRGNTQKRILEKRGEKGPYDFLYGFEKFDLRKSYIIAPRGNRKTLLEKVLSLIEQPFAKKVVLGMPLEIVPLFREPIGKATHLLCINDAISLGVLFYKMLGRLDAKTFVLIQSLPERHKYFGDNKPLVWFISRLLRSADKVLTLSDAAHQPLQKLFHIPRHKLETFYFGVDASYWKCNPKTRRKSFILSVGNDLNRDFQTLVSAVNSGTSVKIVTGTEVKTYDKQVEVVQGLSDAELRALYQSCLFTVIPSFTLKYESSGLSSILQAMSCGSPVIASYAPALAELFEDGKDLLFYEAENPASLKRKIEKLWNDPKLRKQLAQSARQKVEARFTTKHMAQQLEKWVST